MNDQVLMNNYLLVLKSTMEVYVHGTLESSNQEVRQVLKCGLDDTVKHQANTYNEMVSNGWYMVNNVKKPAIRQVLNKVQKS